ncbi:glycosyltransferase family 4 protein [Bacillus sp. 31A1R]|uniref:Glycosyltransferase family 4 protein n=1 Tax=Robertmurraya mangrovi TaxID=3098077 RepID=A0ABU5ITG0_9BACI|nr:glycosyltransferase family 4 protein [Bacillus sp. 31A1R]MDZ5470438.1 glycosyltransferase family 4 protein [Bacillus sp. 31A1R]
MKIAHVCTSSYSHKILMDKLSLLVQSGYEVHIVSSNDGYDQHLLEKFNIKPHFIKMNRKINIKDDIISIFEMIKFFRKMRFDVVHTHTAKAGIIGRIAAKLTKTPVIIHTSHGLPFFRDQNPFTYRMYKTFEKIGSFFCDAICSQNEEDMKALKEMAPNKLVFYEGNGVDLNKLDRRLTSITAEDIEQLRMSLEIEQSRKIILVGARFEPVKDHDFLLKGLNILKENYQNFTCILAGDGPLKSEIIEKVQTYNLEKHIKLVGYQKDIYPLIKLADIVSLTSIKEGIPRILMESMACSKPIVATNVLGTRELVLDQYTGLLVNNRDENALANSLKYLLETPLMAINFGENGRKVIEEKYTEEMVVNRLINIYNDLMKINTKVNEGEN